MTERLADALARIACEILEEAAFVFAQQRDFSPPENGEFVVATLPVSGAVTGLVGLAMQPPLGAEVAANLLGVEPGDPEADARVSDAVGELLNMLAGSLAAQTSAASERWTLGSPHTRVVCCLLQEEAFRAVQPVSLVTDQGEGIWAAVALQGRAAEVGLA